MYCQWALLCFKTGKNCRTENGIVATFSLTLSQWNAHDFTFYCSDWCLFSWLCAAVGQKTLTWWIAQRFYPPSQGWHNNLTKQHFLNAVLQTYELQLLFLNINSQEQSENITHSDIMSVSSPLFWHWHNAQYCRQQKHLQCQHPGGERLSKVIKDEMEWLGKCQWMAVRHSSSLLFLTDASQGYLWQWTMDHLLNLQQLTQTLTSF